MIDFNARSTEEASFLNLAEITDKLELFLQEIDILFSTDENEVLGNAEMGLNLEKYLGKFSLNQDQIQSIVAAKIRENCLMCEHFLWNVTVNFTPGAISDIMHVNVQIKDQENSQTLRQLSFVYR